jgi:hypothetical protein
MSITTNDINRILNKVTPEYQNKIRKAIDYIIENDIHIDASYSDSNKEILIHLKKKKTDIGYFTIDDFGLGRINSMHIEVIEDDAARIGIKSPKNQQLSRFMMLCAFIVIQKSDLPTNKNMLFHIDTDASLGFWDTIGMINVEDYQQDSGKYKPKKGYEKTIELQNILRWVLGTTDIDVLQYKRHRESKTSSNKRNKGGRQTRNKKRMKIRRFRNI